MAEPLRLHRLAVDEALAALGSTREGLPGAEAARRAQEFGPNRLEAARHRSLILALLKEFTHFFALILWLAAGLAFFAEWRDRGSGMATLGFAVVGVIVVNGLFSFWQVYRAERALLALQRLLPHRVRVVRDGAAGLRPAAELVPGDLVHLEEGDQVPADCRLVEAYGVRVDNSALTGESVAQSRTIEASEAELPLEARNLVFAGTNLVGGQALALVWATGGQTQFGRIARLAQGARSPLSPLQREIVRLSRLVALLACAIGVAFFGLGTLLGLPLWQSLLFGIGLIVANVPEGLLPTVTLSLAMSAQRMARKNALVRHLPAVETLGSATVICTDKTGTLTQNRMRARRLELPGRGLDLGRGDALQGIPGHPLFAVARHCHELQRGADGGWLGDPMEVALLQLAERADAQAPIAPRLDELPFDAQRKRQATVHEVGGERLLYAKGALQTLLPLCDRLLEQGREGPLDEPRREEIRRHEAQLAEDGLRVLAFAWRRLPPECPPERYEEGLVFLGLVGLEDPHRPEVPAAIRRCTEAGIRVIMVTGDHPRTAAAVARSIGLVRTRSPRFIAGPELRHLSPSELQLALDQGEVHFARLDPDQKMQIVQALQRKGEIVAVTGDGVNDAPALKVADIGVAMGQSGTDVAREVADIVLTDDNFATIVAAIEEGRAVWDNIRKFLTYILTSNVPEMIPYLAFVLGGLPLGLTIVQILAVDLGTDMVPALGLGAEPPDPAVMQRPPRRRGRGLLDRRLLLRVYLWLGLWESAGGMGAFLFVLFAGGWSLGQPLAPSDLLYRQATTACLSAIIVMQVVNLFVCRSEDQSAFRGGLLANPLLLSGIAVETLLILLIDYTPVGNRILGTAPIAPSAWVVVLPFAAAMLLAEEGRKWLSRRRARAG